MFCDELLEERRLLDRAQALAGREYRQLRALMLTGQPTEIAQAEARLRQELPSEFSNDVGFERLLRIMRREVNRITEVDLLPAMLEMAE